MADLFGVLEMPAQLPAPHYNQEGKRRGNEALGDPGLTRLADYLRAFVNAQFTAAWRTVRPKALPVEEAFTHDPNEVVFNTRDLPAFFLTRVGDAVGERLSEDILLDTTKLRLLWVFDPRDQEDRAVHITAINAVSKYCVKAIELGRHPSYVWRDDPDPTAVTDGSVIYRVAGMYGLTWLGYKISKVQIAFASGASRDRDGERGMYECMEATLELQEQNAFDLDAFPLNRGLDLTVSTPDKARDLAVAKL